MAQLVVFRLLKNPVELGVAVAGERGIRRFFRVKRRLEGWTLAQQLGRRVLKHVTAESLFLLEHCIEKSPGEQAVGRVGLKGLGEVAAQRLVCRNQVVAR